VNKHLVIVLLYVFVGLIPYFGTADKLQPQTLYLALLNSGSILFILFSKNFKKELKTVYSILNVYPVYIFFLFFLWSSLTIFVSVNKVESLVILVEIFLQLLAFIVLIYCLRKLKNLNRVFKNIILALVVVELVSTFVPYIFDILQFGEPISRSMAYRGISGNINILSFSLLMKLPFIYEYSIKNGKVKWIFILISSLIIYAITVILETRSAILSVLLLSSLAFLYYTFKSYLINKRVTLSNILTPAIRILIPLSFVFLLNIIQANQFTSTNSIQDRLSTLGKLNDDSSNQRFRYYSQAIESILKNPLIGIGIGNWELESIKYDAQNISGYVIPYHVHNDYLEIAAETGLIGALIYYLMIFIVLFNLFKSLMLNLKRNETGFEFPLILSIGAYLLDAMFNFPFARPLQQINLIFILSIAIIFFGTKQIKFDLKYLKIKFIFICLLVPFSIYSSIRIFNSSVDQATLLRDYNLRLYNLSSSDIEKMESQYRNLTVTTLPIKSVLGFYYYNEGRYRDAISSLQQGTKYNPYLYFSETNIGLSYLQLNQLDSAKYYTELAFNKLPGNVVHFSNYVATLVKLNDSIGIKDAYNSANNKLTIHDELYFASLAYLLDKDENSFALEDFNINSQSGNDFLKKQFYTLKIGREDMLKGDFLHSKAESFFAEEQYSIALPIFKEAVELNPYEIPYQENLAATYLQLSSFEMVINVIDNIETPTNKAIYLRALAYLNLANEEQACKDLLILEKNNFFGSVEVYKQYCF